MLFLFDSFSKVLSFCDYIVSLWFQTPYNLYFLQWLLTQYIHGAIFQTHIPFRCVRCVSSLELLKCSLRCTTVNFCFCLAFGLSRWKICTCVMCFFRLNCYFELIFFSFACCNALFGGDYDETNALPCVVLWYFFRQRFVSTTVADVLQIVPFMWGLQECSLAFSARRHYHLYNTTLVAGLDLCFRF